MVVRVSPELAPIWVRDRLANHAGTRWVGVDGLGAAGKTSLARRIAAVIPEAAVVSVDDFARPGVPTWDHDLFVRQVLAPLQAGLVARYPAWDLVADRLGAEIEVPPGRLVIVEGVSATDILVPVPWDVTLWVEAPAEIRWQRIVARDHPSLLTRWRDDWLPQEQAYVAAQQPQRRVDAIVVVD